MYGLHTIGRNDNYMKLYQKFCQMERVNYDTHCCCPNQILLPWMTEEEFDYASVHVAGVGYNGFHFFSMRTDWKGDPWNDKDIIVKEKFEFVRDE